MAKASSLKYAGGTGGPISAPTEFLCLTLKLLQLQPDMKIVRTLIKNEDFKYVRTLGAFYLRLTGSPVEIYRLLGPLLNDYRKILVLHSGGWTISHLDEIIDGMLRNSHAFDMALPNLPKRINLEKKKMLKPRESWLEKDFDLGAV